MTLTTGKVTAGKIEEGSRVAAKIPAAARTAIAAKMAVLLRWEAPTTFISGSTTDFPREDRLARRRRPGLREAAAEPRSPRVGDLRGLSERWSSAPFRRSRPGRSARCLSRRREGRPAGER